MKASQLVRAQGKEIEASQLERDAEHMLKYLESNTADEPIRSAQESVSMQDID